MLDIKVEKKVISNVVQKTISVIVLNRVGKKIYESNVLGKPMAMWVENAVKDFNHQLLDYDGKKEVKTFVKSHLNNSDYTLVLYSNIPLLIKGVISHLVEFVTCKESVACKLPVGFMVNTEYLKKSKDIMFDSVYNFNLEYFYEINNKTDLTYAVKKLSQRINNFYLEKGVDIEDVDNVLIEPSVRISAGVTLMSHTTLKGNTSIDKGTIIKENSVIINSTIGKDCLISSSNVVDSTLFDNVCISSFCEIVDSTLKEDVIVGRYSSVIGRTVRKKTHLPERSTYVKTKE